MHKIQIVETALGKHEKISAQSDEALKVMSILKLILSKISELSEFTIDFLALGSEVKSENHCLSLKSRFSM